MVDEHPPFAQKLKQCSIVQGKDGERRALQTPAPNKLQWKLHRRNSQTWAER